MTSPTMDDAIIAALDAIRAMSEEEFAQALYAHANGDVAKMLLETQALIEYVTGVKDMKQFPPGYLWCSTCEALTPHEKRERSIGLDCVVCEMTNYEEGCPNCGWWNERIVEDPLAQEVTLHHPGCHFHESWVAEDTDLLGFPYPIPYPNQVAADFFQNDRKIWHYIWGYSGTGVHGVDDPEYLKRLKYTALYKQYQEESCGCPRTHIYRWLNTWGHWSRQGYEGEWEGGFTVRCPVCNNEFEYTW